VLSGRGAWTGCGPVGNDLILGTRLYPAVYRSILKFSYSFSFRFGLASRDTQRSASAGFQYGLLNGREEAGIVLATNSSARVDPFPLIPGPKTHVIRKSTVQCLCLCLLDQRSVDNCPCRATNRPRPFRCLVCRGTRWPFGLGRCLIALP
jgi:hypothetical protein